MCCEYKTHALHTGIKCIYNAMQMNSSKIHCGGKTQRDQSSSRVINESLEGEWPLYQNMCEVMLLIIVMAL